LNLKQSILKSKQPHTLGILQLSSAFQNMKMNFKNFAVRSHSVVVLLRTINWEDDRCRNTV